MIIGIVLLALGRRLFWLFVAGVGVALGFELAQAYLFDEPFWIKLLIGLAAGIAGALLALLFQKAAIGIAGFVAGGSAAAHLMMTYGWETEPSFVIIALVCGLLGAILLFLLFDWGLILLSSTAGAALIIQAVSWPRPREILLFAVLALGGIIFQGWLFRGPKRPARDSL